MRAGEGSADGPEVFPILRIVLSFELRQKSRLQVGDAAFALPRGRVLCAGERITAVDGRVFEVECAPEKLLHVETAELARAAYHLGNRHVPVQIGEGFLRIAEDHVLEEMLRALGAKVSRIEAPFEPEAGAYGHRHE